MNVSIGKKSCFLFYALRRTIKNRHQHSQLEGRMAKLTKFDVPYAQVPNELLTDEKLSLKAKGLWAYMQSKPQDWNFSAERISRETSEGIDAILSAFKELIDAGYMSRAKQGNGYIIYELLLPKTGKSLAGKTPSRENPVHKKERDSTKKESITNNLVERQAFNRIHDLAVELFEKTSQYKLSPNRKKLLQARLKDAGEPMMVNALKALSQSPFHRGDNERGWKADPYWVFKSYEQTERFAEAYDEIKQSTDVKSLTEIKI